MPNFGHRYLSTIFPDHFFSFQKFIFYDLFLFFVNIGHMGEKNSNDISFESTHHIHSPKIRHTSRKGLYQSCWKNCEISNFGFLPFFSFSLTWDHMGVKVSKVLKVTTPLKQDTRFAPKNSCILLGRVWEGPLVIMWNGPKFEHSTNSTNKYIVYIKYFWLLSVQV